MTDKATPTLRQRCDTALQSLPDAPYKTMLAVLFDDMTAEVERLAAQAAPTEPPQEFESAQGRALASAWAEGWAQCRDAEYVGEEAESEAFNQSHTLAQCLYADQTRFQGGLSNDQLRRAWSAKLPNVIPTDEQLTAFALGIEAAAQPSQAPVVLAVQPEYCTACDMTSNDKQRCEDCPRRASSGATTQAVRMLTPREIELLREIRLHAQFGLNEGWQREARNLLLELEQYYRTIPPSGEIGGA